MSDKKFIGDFISFIYHMWRHLEVNSNLSHNPVRTYTSSHPLFKSLSRKIAILLTNIYLRSRLRPNVVNENILLPSEPVITIWPNESPCIIIDQYEQ